MNLKDEVSWSVSMSNLYTRCPRALYLNKTNPSYKKELIPLGAIIGITVHLSISSIIDKWQMGEDIKISEVQYFIHNKDTKMMVTIQ